MQTENNIKALFQSKFDKEVEVLAKAPGRINVIGEHTDYNLGYVLPAAIDYHMYFGLSKNDKGVFNIYSHTFERLVSLTESDLEPAEDSWLNLVKGIIYQLKDKIGGFDMVIFGDIPVGAGLSSSAALCCGTATALNALFNLDLKKWDIARIAQKSEHDFVHVKCGIMDQFACLFGRTNHVLLLDCETLEFEESETDISGYQFFLINSNVQHELNESEYNARRIESTEALSILKGHNSAINTFKDVSLELIRSLESNEVWWKRAFHIVSENLRVQAVNRALKEKNMLEVGQLISQGHKSQKEYYEITCPETDFLAENLQEEQIVLGARQVGGGFGGCILGIAEDAGVEGMLDRINQKYNQAFNKQITKIPIRISRGCHIIHN